MSVDSEKISDPSKPERPNCRWLALYRDYLVIAVILSAISLVRSLPYFARVLSDFSFVNPGTAYLFVAVANVGLFIFAIRSLRKLGERWVRNFHIVINGVAIIGSIIFFASGLGLIPHSVILGFFGISLANFWSLVPWGHLPEEIHSGIRETIGLLVLALAGTWCFYWVRFGESVPAKLETASVLGIPKKAWLWVIGWTVVAAILAFLSTLMLTSLYGQSGEIGLLLPMLIASIFMANIQIWAIWGLGVLLLWIFSRLTNHWKRSIIGAFAGSILVGIFGWPYILFAYYSV